MVHCIRCQRWSIFCEPLPSRLIQWQHYPNHAVHAFRAPVARSLHSPSICYRWTGYAAHRESGSYGTTRTNLKRKIERESNEHNYLHAGVSRSKSDSDMQTCNQPTYRLAVSILGPRLSRPRIYLPLISNHHKKEVNSFLVELRLSLVKIRTSEWTLDTVYMHESPIMLKT